MINKLHRHKSRTDMKQAKRRDAQTDYVFRFQWTWEIAVQTTF
jgi:hypothetical protein